MKKSLPPQRPQSKPPTDQQPFDSSRWFDKRLKELVAANYRPLSYPGDEFGTIMLWSHNKHLIGEHTPLVIIVFHEDDRVTEIKASDFLATCRLLTGFVTKVDRETSRLRAAK